MKLRQLSEGPNVRGPRCGVARLSARYRVIDNRHFDYRPTDGVLVLYSYND